MVLKCKILATGALAAMTMIGTSASAATLIIVGGELTGAKGVDVNGSLYEVSFKDGTCEALFSGCDEPSDFAFNDADSATQAAHALLDQVFLGEFDLFPERTTGCEDLFFCRAEIPTGFSGRFLLQGQMAVNTGGGLDFDNVALFVHPPPPHDNSRSAISTYAIFTPSVSVVPEPATWAMMIVGFGAVGAALRGKRRRERVSVSYN